MPAFKVGRAWRFDAERLEVWIARQQEPASTELRPDKKSA
jgi:hypothetical protein